MTLLTPELAELLLAKMHTPPRGRRIDRNTVTRYVREMRAGRWRSDVVDPIMVDTDGRMFNGGHRCSAVVASGITVEVPIVWDADLALFDLIDVGRRRAAGQFVADGDATIRASAARLTWWYTHNFSMGLNEHNLGYATTADVIDEAEARSARFTELLPAMRAVRRVTGLPQSLILGTMALASDIWPIDHVREWAAGVVNPSADLDDPRRALAERMRSEHTRSRRRPIGEDWTMLVRSQNAYLFGDPIRLLRMAATEPMIGEREQAYQVRLARLRRASAD